MLVDLSINPEVISRRVVEFIRNSVKKAGFSKIIIGLSGGIDSAVSCMLGAKALGEKNVFIGVFPYGQLNRDGLTNAKQLIRQLKIPDTNIINFDIQPLVDPILRLDPSADKVRKGNCIARVRMMLLFDLAKKHQALVLGTENKTEHLLGYFTRFGDEASDIEPIRGLYKTQVRQLAKYFNISQHIINAIPTAGLWPGQTDEGELDFSYEEADQILYLQFDKKLKKEYVIQQGFEAHVVEKVLDRVKSNEFKHKLPFVIQSIKYG